MNRKKLSLLKSLHYKTKRVKVGSLSSKMVISDEAKESLASPG